MKNLYINTCDKKIVIKYFDDLRIISEETIIAEKNGSQYIMPTIKKVLKEEKPEGIIVVNGPGSFTGVRLGVTIAKTFAYVLNIPIRTVTVLEEMAYSVEEEREVLAVEESNGYYVGIFDDNNNVVGEYKYLKKSEFEEFSKKYKVIVNQNVNYDKVIKEVLKKNPENSHFVKPVYVKLIEVEK